MDEAGTFSTAADPRTLERDEELAFEARSDPRAFGVLYQRHRLAVFRYLRTRTASEDDAAELTAIAFERALRAMARYRSSGGGVLAWLLRIARNAAVDAGRRTSTVPMPTDLLDERASGSPETAVLDAERHAALAEAVNRLPDVQREALALRYTAGLTAREIGAVIGKSEQATQKLLSRAIVALREEYRHDR